MKNCYLLNRNPQATFGYTRKEPVRGSFEDVQLEGYRNPCVDKGIIQVQEGTLASLIAQKRLELFRLFGGQLEKACSLTAGERPAP